MSLTDNLPGSGTNYKLLLSMYSSVAVAALSETMALAEHLGLDQFTLLEIYRGSDVGSRHMTKKGKSIVEVRQQVRARSFFSRNIASKNSCQIHVWYFSSLKFLKYARHSGELCVCVCTH